MKRTAQTLANFAAIVSVWFLCVVLLTLIPGVTKTVMIPYPLQSLANNLPEGISILRWDTEKAVLYSERPGYVSELYFSGAGLVLPSRKSSCLDLAKKAA